MIDNDYYTPELEDLYVGYICFDFTIKGMREIKDPEYMRTISHISKNVDNKGKITYDLKDILKTKYLDKDDIESLSFKYKETIRSGDYFIKDNLGLIYIKEGNILMIYKIIESINQNEMLFQGNCKSINELKKIIKYLGY